MTTICAYCKRVKHGSAWAPGSAWYDKDIIAVAEGRATHGICPNCLATEEAKLNAASVASLHARQECGENPASTGGASTPFSPVTVHTSVAPGVTVALGAEGEA